MKRLITSCLILVANFSTNLFSQSEKELTPFDWLRGNRINNFIQIKLKNDVIKWRDGGSNDDLGNYFSMSNKEGMPSIFRAKKAKMNLKLAYYNPIVYSVIINKTNREDPLYRTALKFSENLLSIFNTVSGGLEGYTPPITNTLSVLSSNSTKSDSTKTNQKKENENKYDIQNRLSSTANIANWYLWYHVLNINSTKKDTETNKFIEQIDKLKKDKNTSNTEKIEYSKIQDFAKSLNSSLIEAQKIEQIGKIVFESENYIHKQFKLSSAEDNTFLNYLKSSVKKLSEAYNNSTLSKANEDAIDLIEHLQEKQLKIKSSLQIIQNYNYPISNNDEENIKQFANYTEAEFKSYANDAIKVLEKRDLILSQFLELTNSVRKYLDEDVTREIDINIGEVELISITYLKRNIVIDENQFTITNSELPRVGYCIVNEGSWAVPELAAGIAFPTDLSFSNYDIDLNKNDKYQIVDKGKGNSYLVGGLFMNLIFDARISPGIFPMLQLGVGVSKQAIPTLMGGIGIRIYNKLSFSIGLIGAFDNKLTVHRLNYEFPNNETAKEEFHSSLKSKLISGGNYIGLQWKF